MSGKRGATLIEASTPGWRAAGTRAGPRTQLFSWAWATLLVSADGTGGPQTALPHRRGRVLRVLLKDTSDLLHQWRRKLQTRNVLSCSMLPLAHNKIALLALPIAL